nr:glycosyl hydrolase [uncultured Rhodoferax sp.]
MSTKILKQIGIISFLTYFIFASSSILAAEKPELEPLFRPASVSVRIQHYLMNSVVKAGERKVSAGERGVIMLSDDDGKSWRQSKKVPVSVTLTRLFFIDQNIGWATGHSGVVLGTMDGGENWALLLDGKRAATLEFEAAQMDSNNIERKNGAKRMVQEGADKPFFDIYFNDERNGLVVGAYGLAFVTNDGGKSWKSSMDKLMVVKGRHLYSIHRINNDLYVTGEQGGIYKSTANSLNFDALAIPAKGTIFGLIETKNGDLLAYGLRGLLIRLNKDGIAWSKIETQPLTITAGLLLKNGDIIFANEAGEIYKSDDQGKSFKVVPQPYPSTVVGLVETSDGALLLAGTKNLTRLSINNLPSEHKK